ncbi:MAG: isochorismatase family protein [Spirochaetes bacterium]|nr:isochorismatase family protein [Spirochaetota bacterium]MBU1079851.1 isochorismatase family protein [Spirochaetota bacterium]
MKMALMVIDLQKAYYAGTSRPSMDAASEYVNAALAAFRKKSLPVVWVQHVDEDDGSVPGSVGFELIDALEPLEGEHRIQKRYGNAFNKTDCGAYLASLGVDTVVMAGYCAEYCVLSTCRGAKDLDLTPILLRGSLASGNPERIPFVEAVNDVVSYGALLKMLEASLWT